VSNQTFATSPVRRVILAISAAAVLSGCNVDSWMADPSALGRWENTPVIVPVLDRLSIIEDAEDDYVEVTGVQPQDLIPELTEYRVAPGDGIHLVIYDLIREDVPEQYDRVIDPQGHIDLPILGRLYVDGMSAPEIEDVVKAAMSDLVAEPLVSVNVQNPRQQTYNVIGGLQGGGSFFIPKADFRLLEALTVAGGLSETTAEVYIIRQQPLTGAAAGQTAEQRATPPTKPTEPAETGEELLNIIEDLSGDEDKSSVEDKSGGGGMAAMSQPDQPDQPDQPEPEVDLIDEPPASPDTPPDEPPTPGSSWVFLNGQWVQVEGGAQQQPEQPAENKPGLAAEQLVTQRVIRVRTRPMFAGDARYNPVIRPGDIIRIPSPSSGNVYIGGEVSRPGVYNVAPQLTLLRLITSAGGLTPLARTARVDLTRMVGSNRQATIRLNLGAIAEGTQPDIFIKSNDRIVIGTDAWATPLAVIRSGFRTSYGFGFLLDRNFGNDVFGAPPTNNLR